MTELLDAIDMDLVSVYESSEIDEQIKMVLPSVEASLDRNFDDAPEIIIALRSVIREFIDSNAEFLGCGTTRICFSYGDDQVVKIPINWHGIDDSNNEADTYAIFAETGEGIPTASCNFAKFDNDNILLLVMERLRSFPDSRKDLPDWTDFVDCCQVGYNSAGELVAYDL